MSDAPAAGNSTKFADKFDTPEAFEAGFSELHKKVYGDDVPLPTFSDVPSREKAYKGMERILGKITAPPPKQEPAQPSEPVKLGVAIDDDAGVDKVLEAAGLKADEVAKQWKDKGELTAEQYAKFKNAGFGKGVVNAFMAGQAAQGREIGAVMANIKADLVQMSGGDAQFEVLRSTAPQFVPPEELDDIKRRINDPRLYKGAWKQVMAYHAEAVGAGKSVPIVAGGAPAGAGGVQPASDIREFNRLVKDAAAGDKAALARVNATTPEMLSRWG